MTHYAEIQQQLMQRQCTWLITGVAGFIGSNLLEKLLILNQRVIGIDNFQTGYQHNVDQAIEDASQATGEDKSRSFHFIKGDICKLEECQRAMKWPEVSDNSGTVDYVLHQAALGSVPRSIQDPVRTNHANISGFLNMLVVAKDNNVSRFVYAASSSTYGDHPDLPKTEDKIGDPLSPYAVTKLVNEIYANVFCKVYGFKAIGLRYFNIFGKRQDPQGAYAAVIPKWISSIVNNEEVFINGDGNTSRDFCYIDNVVQVNLLAAMVENDKAVGQVYNVALNDRTSLNQLYEMIENRLFILLNRKHKKKPVYLDFRPGDVRHSQANISKAEELLGYVPSHKISEGLDEVVDWYMGSINKNI